MNTIYKYQLQPGGIIEIPSLMILSVESQGHDIVVYALVDKDMASIRKPFKYDFQVIPTGGDIEVDISEYEFLGTVKIDDGKLMFHVFYKLLTG